MTAPAQSRRSANGGRAYVWPPAPAPTELNVTRELAKAQKKLDGWKGRHK